MNKKKTFGTVTFTLLTIFSFALFFSFVFIGLYDFKWIVDVFDDLFKQNTFYLISLSPLLLSLFAILSLFFLIGYFVGLANKSRSTSLVGSLLFAIVFGFAGMISGLDALLLLDFDLSNSIYLCSIISSITSFLFMIFSIVSISFSYKEKSYKACLIISIFALIFALSTFVLNCFALDIFSSLDTFFALDNLLDGNMYRFVYPFSLVIFSIGLIFLPKRKELVITNE